MEPAALRTLIRDTCLVADPKRRGTMLDVRQALWHLTYCMPNDPSKWRRVLMSRVVLLAGVGRAPQYLSGCVVPRRGQC